MACAIPKNMQTMTFYVICYLHKKNHHYTGKFREDEIKVSCDLAVSDDQ